MMRITCQKEIRMTKMMVNKSMRTVMMRKWKLSNQPKRSKRLRSKNQSVNSNDHLL